MDVTRSCILPPLGGQDADAASHGVRSPLARPRATSAPSMVAADWLNPSHSGPHATAVCSRASSRGSGDSPTCRPATLAGCAPPAPRRQVAVLRRPSKAEQDARTALEVIAPAACAVIAAGDDAVAKRRALFRLGVMAFDYDERQRAELSWTQAAAIPRAEGDVAYIAAMRRDAAHPIIKGVIDALEHLCLSAPVGEIVAPEHVQRELNLVYFRVAEQIQREHRAEKLDFFAGKDVTRALVERRDIFLSRIPFVDSMYCKSIEREPHIATLWLRYCRFADDFFPLLRPNYQPRKSPQACFEMAERLGPETADDYADFGVLLKARNRPEEARAALSEALKRQCADAHRVKGILLGLNSEVLQKRPKLENDEHALLAGASRAAHRRRGYLRPSAPSARCSVDATELGTTAAPLRPVTSRS